MKNNIPWYWTLSLYTNWVLFLVIFLAELTLLLKLKFKIDFAAKLTLAFFLFGAVVNLSQTFINPENSFSDSGVNISDIINITS